MENRHKGEFEYLKFDHRREDYDNGIKAIKNLDYQITDFIEHFPCFSGHMTISRFIGLYELYKKSLGIAGHIGEVGVYKGASLLWFAKLVQIFESESLTQVHGFDWFEGTGTDEIELKIDVGSYKESYPRLLELIESQKLNSTVFVHKMDVTKELEAFLDKYKHLQFKLLFLDAGAYNVVKSVLPLLWERLSTGGILILDQFNHELSPGETIAVREFLGNSKIQTLQNIWMPSAYIVKE